MNSPAATKAGRNDPCPCGSGRKFKACCFREESGFRVRAAADIAGWFQRARQSAMVQDFEDAEFWFRRIVEARPTDAIALAGLGQSLCWHGKRREGKGYLARAARQLERQALKTRDPVPLVELSGQLQHWGEMEAALRLARLAVHFAPKSAQALNNLAVASSRVNRVEEALPAARKACELTPEHPGSNILLAILDSRQGRWAEARDRLDRVIAAGQEPEQTARAWLELATILDKQGEHQAAFAALQRASELHRSLPSCLAADRSLLFETIARNRSGFDSGLLNAWPPGELRADGLPAPVFLTGFLRSGTTLAEQALAAHPRVITSDESNLIFELTLELARLSGIPRDVPAGLKKVGIEGARRLRALFWRRVEEEYGVTAINRLYVDKNAMNTIELGLISAIFPDSKILFALRDPRDVCLSCYMQAFNPAPATVNLLTWEGVARQYAAVMDFWLAIRDSITPAWLELRYEDAVSDFEGTLRRVFEFLGLEWRAEVLAFHEKARGRFIATPSFAAVSQPVYGDAVARWKPYANHFAVIGPELDRFVAAFGY